MSYRSQSSVSIIGETSFHSFTLKIIKKDIKYPTSRLEPFSPLNSFILLHEPDMVSVKTVPFAQNRKCACRNCTCATNSECGHDEPRKARGGEVKSDKVREESVTRARHGGGRRLNKLRITTLSGANATVKRR